MERDARPTLRRLVHALRHGADVSAVMLRVLDDAEQAAARIDWSGLWQDPTPQEAPPVDPGTDDVLTGRTRPDRLPRPSPRVMDTSCFPAASNAINVLAHTVNTETDGGGLLSLNPVVAVGLMLMQLNTYRVNRGNWRQLGTWTVDANALPDLTSRPDLMALAERVLDAVCRSTPKNLLLSLTEVVPDLAAVPCLSEIANNPDARFEISIDAKRVDEFRNDPAYRGACVLPASGAPRAVVIGYTAYHVCTRALPVPARDIPHFYRKAS